MAFLDGDRVNSLRITRMIFHIVGHRQGKGIRTLREIDPAPHHDFFIERVRTVLAGNVFIFEDGSKTLAELTLVRTNEKAFRGASCRLARAFDTEQRKKGNTKPGVFLMLQLQTATESLFALIKFDNEEVLQYRVKKQEGEPPEVIMKAIKHTFVKNRDALQKAAIIRLNETGGEICVADPKARLDITDYFRDFLHAKRRYDDGVLTERLCDAALATKRAHDQELPREIKMSFRERMFDTVHTQTGFDANNAEPFLTALFGPLPEDSHIRETFERQLSQRHIAGESFKFNRDTIKRPPRRRMVTREGVEIVYPSELENNRVLTSREGEETIITIRTIQVDSDDFYTENAKKRH